eukprot:5133989-Amphidinium_carterae.1
MGCHRGNGMPLTTWDVRPLVPKLWDDSSGWDVIDGKFIECRPWMGCHWGRGWTVTCRSMWNDNLGWVVI